MPQLNLDEGAAIHWLDLVIAAEAGDKNAMARLGGDYPSFDDDWDPASEEEAPQVSRLIRAAQEAQIITGPEAQVAFERISGEEGEFFRWLVTLKPPYPSLTLASSMEEINLLAEHGAYGAVAALSVLDDAVRAANGLLEALMKCSGVSDETDALALVS